MALEDHRHLPEYLLRIIKDNLKDYLSVYETGNGHRELAFILGSGSGVNPRSGCFDHLTQ